MKDKITVIGLGYVGLPLAINLSKYYKVYGYDISKDRVNQLKKNFDINNEYKKKDFFKSQIEYLTEKDQLPKNSNVFIVTVPTPVNKFNKPNLNPLISACKLIGKYINKNNLVIIESTVAPGTTKGICLDVISSNSSLKKENINICFSPERINPGDKKNQLNNLVKIISGTNKNSVIKCKKIYEKVCKKVVIAKTIETAELAKIIENVQRDINIAFQNEVFKICDTYNIDYWHMLDICKTKWNFIDFKAGLVGGHCVSVDPYYLLDDLKKKKITSKLIKESRKLNEDFVEYIINKIKKILKINNSKKILLYGVSFKDNVSDIRNSKYLSIFKKLDKKYNCRVYLDKNQRKIKDLKSTYLFDYWKYDTLIIGSKNRKLKKYLEQIQVNLKKKFLIINILGSKIISKNKLVKVNNF